MCCQQLPLCRKRMLQVLPAALAESGGGWLSGSGVPFKRDPCAETFWQPPEAGFPISWEVKGQQLTDCHCRRGSDLDL